MATYLDGVGEEMDDDEVREALRVTLLSGWDTPHHDISVTLHRDGGATLHMELRERHVQGVVQTW